MDANSEAPQESSGGGAATSVRGPNRLGTIAGMVGVVGILIFFSFTRGLGLSVAIGGMLLGFAARSQARSHHLRTGMANVAVISGVLLSALYPLTLYLETIWPV